MEMLMVWVVAVAGMAVGAVLSTVFFRMRAAAIIDSAVALARSALEVEVATQSSRARSAETDLLQARLEVQRMQEGADGWRRALESLSEERVRLSERANRVATLEADAARLALQTRLTEEEMRRLSASEAQKEQVIASLRDEMRQRDAANAAVQARLDTSSRLLHQSNERRAVLEEQVSRAGPLEQQVRDANARHAQLHQHLLESRASAGVFDALKREVAELRHWARTVLDGKLQDLQAWQQRQGTGESAAPPAAKGARRHSPARPSATVVAGRRRLRR
jgi:DNA recombination protein RmuC